MRNCSAPPRAAGAQHRRDRTQARRAAILDLVLPGRAVHVLQDRPDAERGCPDRGPGGGVRRRARVRLLLGLSPLPSRVRRAVAVLPGPPDPRREVPHDAGRPAGPGLRRGAARGLAKSLRRDPPAGRWRRRSSDAAGRGAGQGAAARDAERAADASGGNLAKRFETHGESYFRFITTPGIEPTNNLAEQAIRFVVIDRLVTQGTRSDRGDRWCERIWTVTATCAQQGRSVFEYLESAVSSWFAGEEAPTLLPRST